MYRALSKATPLLAVLVLSTACASSRLQGGEPDSAPDCAAGNAVLIVRNESGGDVEIVETRIGSGGRTAIAVVGTGRHEVRIRNESAYAYHAQRVGGGTVLAATSRPRMGEREVTLQRECRGS